MSTVPARSTLVFGARAVARITYDASDFPTFDGTYEILDAARVDPELRHVLAYVEMSVATWSLVDADRWEELAEHEAPFLDLIESLEWALVAADGERIGIGIPNFTSSNALNWRLR